MSTDDGLTGQSKAAELATYSAAVSQLTKRSTDPKKAEPVARAAGSSKPLKIAPAFTPRKKQQQSPQQQPEKPETNVDLQNLNAPNVSYNALAAGTDEHLRNKSLSVKDTETLRHDDGTEDDLFLRVPQASSNMTYMKPVEHFSIDETLRRVLAGEMRAEYMVTSSELPFQIHNYYSLTPEESLEIHDQTGVINVQTIKAQSIVDGNHYCLHRVNVASSATSFALHAVDTWKAVQNPGIARVHEAFTTRAFGDNSLIIVYDYKPLSLSLKTKIVDAHVPVPETFLWTLVLQLASALRSIHSAGLAVNLLNVSTVILSTTNRVYINSCGLSDVLSLWGRGNVNAAQQSDLHSIGQILGTLLGNSQDNIISIQGQPPVIMPGPSYSTDFKELFGYLNGRLTPVIAIDDILRLAGSRIFNELDAVRRDADLLHSSLRLEMGNGRLVRLMCKINFITERAENDMDPEWSETGDRYLIKLFRDFVFHLVNENGHPVADMAHVIGNLNKLDAGSEEKVMLMSRDEKSCLVVSYNEIKRCIEDAFRELLARSRK
ncbi:PAB-dependent poly(A)-specific ribonuclease subunit 3 [Coemansia sp. RSA 2603]|nr:PAB-dependent poly(A)-specific ribonuclease subunit 3 [Coemansia sp. RSA 2603]